MGRAEKGALIQLVEEDAEEENAGSRLVGHMSFGTKKAILLASISPESIVPTINEHDDRAVHLHLTDYSIYEKEGIERMFVINFFNPSDANLFVQTFKFMMERESAKEDGSLKEQCDRTTDEEDAANKEEEEEEGEDSHEEEGEDSHEEEEEEEQVEGDEDEDEDDSVVDLTQPFPISPLRPFD